MFAGKIYRSYIHVLCSLPVPVLVSLLGATGLAAVQAASKTNDTAGDGTTTATILSAAIIAEGMKIVAAGTNPVQLCRGIEATVSALVKDLQAISTDVTDADLANVATVSAGGNETVRARSMCMQVMLLRSQCSMSCCT